jgi:broad specificity phosphatase PhoE
MKIGVEPCCLQTIVHHTTIARTIMIHRQPQNSNKFFALRHGQSRANVQKIICSNPSIATTADYGLSEVGQQQALQAGQDVIDAISSDESIKGLCIVSSDFARALETAETIRKVYCNAQSAATGSSHRMRSPPVYNNQVIIDTRLRERWFGDYDMQSDSNYQSVWERDAEDSSQTLHQVESVDSVRSRAVSVVNEYETLLQDHMVILVAHGDVLQILQTAFLSMDARKHRSLEHLETAKLRQMDRC